MPAIRFPSRMIRPAISRPLLAGLVVLFGVCVMMGGAVADGHLTGDLLGFGLIWYAAVRFTLEFLRTGNWRIDGIATAQIFSVGFAVFGLETVFADLTSFASLKPAMLV